jgi:hypothetical protein
MRRSNRDSLSLLTNPIYLQRLERGVLLLLSLLIYGKLGGPWLWYIVLILAPDLFMLGYLGGTRLGAAVCNLGHTWVGHIGGDRLLGYGLKLPTGFQDTHLGRIGRNR